MDQLKESKAEIRKLLHELANPLHVLKFCVTEIGKNPEKAKNAEFAERMARNMALAETTFEKIRVLVRDV